MKFIRESWRLIVSSVLLCGCLLSAYVIVVESRGGVMRVVFLDVGQGDSILIETPRGVQVLIDGGPTSAVVRRLGAVLPLYDKSLDMIIATHPDKDHIGGLTAVLERYSVGRFLDSGLHTTSSPSLALKRVQDARKVESIMAERGMRYVLDDDVYLDILFPDRLPNLSWDTNTASVIARLVYGATSFMLTGDAPKMIERFLVRTDGADVKSTVLKLGHHGSKTSTDAVFLAAVQPQFVVVSAEKDNRYGHPHAEVMERVDAAGVREVASTADMGTFTLYSDGRKVWLGD